MVLARSSTRLDLRLRHRPRMVETQMELPGLNQRTLLRHVKPKHLAQRLVQEVGGRAVGACRGAACMIDLEID